MSNMGWIVIGVAVVIVVILAVFRFGAKLKPSDSEKEFIGGLKKFRNWMLFGCVVFIIAFACSILGSLNTDANDKYKDYKDKYGITFFVFTEAKCLMGSIYNKKTLILSDDNIEIFSGPCFHEKKTVRPYNTLKEVTFSRVFIGYKGTESGYKVVIEYSGGFKSDKFYFNQKDTFVFLKTVFEDYCKNRYVITEFL
jgi:hypothetical protein